MCPTRLANTGKASYAFLFLPVHITLALWAFWMMVSGANGWAQGSSFPDFDWTNMEVTTVSKEEPRPSRAQFNLAQYREFDTALHRVGRWPSGSVPKCNPRNTRRGWRVAERMEVSVGGQNRLDPRDREFNGWARSLESAQHKRSGFGGLPLRV